MNATKYIIISLVLALGMVVSSYVLSRFFVRIEHEQQITVKGYAEKMIKSNVATFGCSYSRRDASLEAAYKKTLKDKNRVVAFLKEKGINEKNIKINAITSRKIYRKGKYYNYTNEIEYYKVTQSAEVTTNDVDKARRVSGLISELIKDGLDIEASTPKYYVSSLDSVKVELIAKATGNGHQRALIMAQKTGGTVGSLSSATQGVFQITKPNSTQISGYGNTIHLPLIK